MIKANQPPESRHNRNLDILRGVAALTVVGFHLISCYPKAFDKVFEIGPYIHYNFPGHMSVLVFFILSGYVISINTPLLANKLLIKDYIRKRLTRIVPIYIIALLFTVAITWGQYDWKVILSNLFFVSVPFNNVISEDGPLWSLNYELIYYFVFILFSYFRISMVKTVKVLIIIIALMFVFFHNVKIYPLPVSYLIGFLFWATGAMIADIKTWRFWKIAASKVVAVFILMYCMQAFNPYGPILKVLKLAVVDYTNGGTFTVYSWYQQSIFWTDLYYYPLTILLILALTHAYTKWHHYLIWFIYISAFFRMFMIYKVYDMDFIIKEHYIVPAAILILSLVLWVTNFDFGSRFKNLLKSTSSLGSISYGVYMIHMPLICLFGMTVATSGFYFGLKLVGYVIALLATAYLLELKFQPFIKKLIRKKRSAQNGILPNKPQS